MKANNSNLFKENAAFSLTENGSALRSKLRHLTFRISIFVIALFILSPQLFAQTGVVRGDVKDAVTGESLIGAYILLKDSDKGTTTDLDGRYVFRNLPVGNQTLVYRYLGYEPVEVVVEVIAGEVIEKDMQLSSISIEGEEITVTAQQRGQSRALSEQRKSVNIKNVISAEQIEGFADNTVTGALSRIAGMGHGGTNIRGVGAGSANVTMDGQRMGATGGDRSIDLSTISADMVQDLEVIKVITPDMDADALAGVINVNTRRPVGGERSMNIRVGGGFQDRYMRYAGTQRRASVSYGDSPTDFYSFGVNFSYQNDPTATETFRTDWDSRSFGTDDPVDILSDVGTELNFSAPERFGTGLQFTFQPTAVSTYHVQGMFNYQDRQRTQYGMTYVPRMQNYTNENWTGYPDGGGGPDAANQSIMRYNPRLDEAITHQYTVQAGASHRMKNFDLEYSLGWGHGRFNEDQYRMEFQTNSRYEFVFDKEDRWNPRVDIAPWSINNSYPSETQLVFQDMDHRVESSTDNNYKGSIDFTIPIDLGEIKVGGSAMLTYMRGVGERYLRTYGPRLDVNTFPKLENGDWSIFQRNHSTYSIPWLIDMEKAKDFYISQTPRFDTDLEEWALTSETSRYNANENTYGTYAMGKLMFPAFNLIGGLRFEYTHTNYTGREGEINDSGIFQGAKDISSSNAYYNFFPNFQTVFKLGDMTNLRLAYSRSIGRPTFSQLNPYVMRNYASQTISQGNPNLDPMLSNNYDLLFEHYFMNVGQLTFGLFYKDMKDFVFSYTERISGDINDPDAEFVGWRRNGFRNGDEATVYGAEFTWQQNLEFLPGILSNLGTYFNYSYAQSIADLGRDKEQSTHGAADLLDMLGFDVSKEFQEITPLEGQRPHIINVGLDFEKGGLSTQISYQWSDVAISSYGSNDRQWVALVSQPVYFDEYNEGASDLSFTARYWVTENFQIWIDASNLLNSKEINYYYDRDTYPARTRLNGREFTAGLRFRL